VELLPVVNHSSEGAASKHRERIIKELKQRAQSRARQSVVLGMAAHEDLVVLVRSPMG
jgi:hypothetical protein